MVKKTIPPGLVPFTKNDPITGKKDPRINRKGRPKSFKMLRELAKQIAHEKAIDKNDVELVVNGHLVTAVERIVRNWASSTDKQKQQAFIELAYGKTPLAKDPAKSTGEYDWLDELIMRLPADSISPSFAKVYRDIVDHGHTEYLFYGGRGSTKSSFVSLVIVSTLMNAPDQHAVVIRKVGATLRNSAYAQVEWAIHELGVEKLFKCIKNPLEITYKPTKQKIYFRGADDPGKLKSIKTSFGYISMLWFEELDQFAGPREIRVIEQSVIRGGDTAYIFKSFNPPQTANNWANKYTKIPKDSQYQHFSNYLQVPVEWLGQVFLDEAAHLKSVNPAAYDHEYGGIANATGGLVFNNVKIRKITDEEIETFDTNLFGLDWGYYPDPAHYVRMYFNPAKLTLYIFDEYRAWKMGNEALYDKLVEKGLTPANVIIADSAEPKSIADFRAYGASCRGAEKGPGSVNYSMKWLQTITMVIDNERAPYTADEVLAYELERTKDGDIISGYPDKDNHAIAAIRYGTNLIWRRRGKGK